MSVLTELSEEQLQSIYAWIDGIPLSRPKRNMARDFCDGVLLAEVVSAYFPHLVELHNYTSANSLKHKMENLTTLNARVLKKLGFTLPRQTLEDVANCKPGVVEQVLNALQYKMAKFRERNFSNKNSPMGGAGESPEVKVQRTSNNSQVSGADNIRVTVDQSLLLEKEQQIRELQENVEVLELKIAKLEQLLRLKDAKIQKLMSGNMK